MEARLKAKELLTKYSCYFHGIDENVNYAAVLHNDAKQCALIAVDEKIYLLNELDEYFLEAGHDRNVLEKAMEIQLEVKQEIEKLK